MTCWCSASLCSGVNFSADSINDMSMPASTAARHAGPAPGGITYLPLIWANVSSSIIRELFRVPLVNANRIAVRVRDERHLADRRRERFHFELHALGAQ